MMENTYIQLRSSLDFYILFLNAITLKNITLEQTMQLTPNLKLFATTFLCKEYLSNNDRLI